MNHDQLEIVECSRCRMPVMGGTVSGFRAVLDITPMTVLQEIEAFAQQRPTFEVRDMKTYRFGRYRVPERIGTGPTMKDSAIYGRHPCGAGYRAYPKAGSGPTSAPYPSHPITGERTDGALPFIPEGAEVPPFSLDPYERARALRVHKCDRCGTDVKHGQGFVLDIPGSAAWAIHDEGYCAGDAEDPPAEPANGVRRSRKTATSFLPDIAEYEGDPASEPQGAASGSVTPPVLSGAALAEIAREMAAESSGCTRTPGLHDDGCDCPPCDGPRGIHGGPSCGCTAPKPHFRTRARR